jgi:hypothetical protein
MHRLLQFFALRAAKLRFLAVAVAKLKFCNSLSHLNVFDFFGQAGMIWYAS